MAALREAIRELRTEIEIDAPPERVWDVLTDFGAYPEWNEFITSIKGEPTVGSRLLVHIEPPGGRGMTFKPTVQAVEPARELRWLGRLVIPGIFDGEHRLAIEPLGEGRSRFLQSERFTGFLVGLFGRTLGATERRRAGRARRICPPAWRGYSSKRRFHASACSSVVRVTTPSRSKITAFIAIRDRERPGRP